MEQRRAAEIAEKRKTWEDRIKGWKESGLSQAEYCRAHELKKYQFLYWKKRIMPDKARLVEVPLAAPIHSVPKPLSLSVGSRYSIRIEAGFDADTLRELLEVLER